MVYRSKNDQVFRVINTILLLLVVFMCLYPLYFTVIASFSDAHEVVRGNVVLWPKGFTLESYQAVFKYKQLWVGYRNTLIYTVVGTLYNLFLLMPSAYAKMCIRDSTCSKNTMDSLALLSNASMASR